MRSTPSLYFKALNRHFTILGVNAQLFFLFIGLTLPIIFSGRFSPVMLMIGIPLFFILHVVGVLLTRTDPQILEIYRRHIHYKKYYPAISGMHAKPKLIKPSVPYYEGKKGLV